MANMIELLGAIVTMIAVAIGLLVFGTILPNLNQLAIGASAYTLLQQTPIIVAGVALLGIRRVLKPLRLFLDGLHSYACLWSFITLSGKSVVGTAS